MKHCNWLRNFPILAVKWKTLLENLLWMKLFLVQNPTSKEFYLFAKMKNGIANLKILLGFRARLLCKFNSYLKPARFHKPCRLD